MDLWGIFSLLILGIFFFTACEADEKKVPAMYVFGDSLVDVGNNNYLKLSLAKANFPHNGIDYPGQKVTGRFSNGKNAADFLAERLGLASPPPYLSLVSLPNKVKGNTQFPVTGVSFASGGAGIFNTTNQLFLQGQTISLAKQIEKYTEVHEDLVQQLGSVGAQTHLSKSLFYIVICNNDLIAYFNAGSDLPKQSTPQQYVDLMVLTLKDALKKLHSLGARKFMVAGAGAIGCCPAFRNQNRTAEEEDGCDEEANHWSVEYNQALGSMLQDLKASELGDINYSYVDLFNVFSSFLQSSATYGFIETKSACCGLGNLRAEVPCLPISKFCPNRTNHIFWDLYHPSEASSRIFIDIVYSGSAPFAMPINVEQLILL